MAERLVGKVRATIEGYEMADPGERIIVAVSGGPDSVCLLDVLHRLSQTLDVALSIAHFEHGLRPGEDEAETSFVASLAKGYGIPFETARAEDLYPEIPSLEERARKARYRFLEEVRSRLCAQKIALGHHLDDQAETVLMRLMRGSGPSGLGGILPCRDGTFIRPMIRVSREEIEAYLREKNLAYVTDLSNFDQRRTRNWVRHELIPRIKSRQPRAVEILGRTAEILAGDEECLALQARAWVSETANRGTPGAVEIPVGALCRLHKAVSSRVIRHLLEEIRGDLRRVSFRHIRAALSMAEGPRPQARIDLPDGLVVERVYEKLVFRVNAGARPRDYAYVLKGPGTYPLDVPRCTLVLEEFDRDRIAEPEEQGGTAFMDAEALTYPLVARSFRPGDRFIPLGMGGHKKVKAFFGDLKVPSGLRRRIPILTSRDRPVWVCGFRIDDRVKVRPSTRRVIKGTFAVWDSGE